MPQIWLWYGSQLERHEGNLNQKHSLKVPTNRPIPRPHVPVAFVDCMQQL